MTERDTSRGGLAATLAMAVLVMATGCQGSHSGAPSASIAPAVHPTPTHSSSYQAASSPVVTKPIRTYNRPPYSAALSNPGVDSEYPGEGTDSVDALHYGLDLTWAAATRQLTGTATIRFRATRSESEVSLDFGASLHAVTVKVDGRVVGASHPGPKLLVSTGLLQDNSRHTLVVHYHGTPRSYVATGKLQNLSGLGWTVNSDSEVWTPEEPFGAYTWFPVNDQPSDKAFYDITWHTKSAWTGVSNGQLVADSVHHGERTAHWELDSPAASYLVTAAIGPYHEYVQTGPHSLLLTYWVTDADKSVLHVLSQTPAMLRWLEARLGRYPFDSLGDVVVPIHSAIETQTMVTMGAPILRSSAGPTDLLHEYVHSWYGDEVTPTDWKDLWLNETFAYYVQLTWEASHGVTTTATWRAMLNHDDQALRTQYGPPGDPRPADFAALNVYECGARMLDRLHSRLGDKVFAKVLHGWPHLHRFGSATRNEWISYLDHTTGMNLRPFIEHWLNSKKTPA